MTDLRYFTLDEFNCKHTGTNYMEPAFLEKLDILRYKCGFPFHITSGYRDPTHPEEVKKPKPGTHSQGIAADIRVQNGTEKYRIVQEAIALGFNGIGIAKTFIHVDTREGTPVIWTY